MGGFVGAGLKDFFKTAFTGGGKEGAASELHDLFGAKDDVFHLAGDDGKAIQALHMSFQEMHSKNLKMLDKPLNDLQQGLFEGGFKDVHNDTTSLGDIHSTLKKANHPAAQIAHAIINQDPSNYSKTLNQLKISNSVQARTLAGAQAFGDKFQNISAIVMPYLESNDPVKRHWGQLVLDTMSNELHDTSRAYNPRLQASTPASKLKETVQLGIARENKVRARLTKAGVADVGPRIKSIDISPTYHTPSIMERRVGNVLRAVQLPMVALKHISQYGNLSSVHATQLVRGLLGLSDQEFQQHLQASSILAFTEHDMMDKFINGRFGKVASFTNPTAGDLLYRSYHMPFFDYLRTQQLTYAASVGYNAANDWAAQAVKGDRRALAELAEMGIDVNEVAKQGGKLTDEQKVKAMFHFVNNRFFMDKSIERSLYSNKNMFMRSATMYHTFVNAQQRFMRRELRKMYKSGDVVGIAQFAGTIGLLWPAVAPMIKSLEVFGRTGSFEQAKKSEEDDYNKLMTGSFGDRALTYIDLLAHYGAFGVYTGYVAAARTDRFAYQLLGPNIGTAARGVSDALHATFVRNKMGKHNVAPVVRDVLEDTIPIAGNIMAHHIAPTTKELSASRGHRPQRPRRQRPSGNMWEF